MFPSVEIYCVLVQGQHLQMTLYHRGENQVEFVPSCPTSRDPRLVPEDADLEEVLLGYPNIS